MFKKESTTTITSRNESHMTKRCASENDTLLIDGITIPLSIIRSSQRKRTITFKVRPDKTLIIQAPTRMSLKTLHDLAYKRSAWILARINDIQQNPDNQPKYQLISGENIPYLGRSYPLQISVICTTITRCQLRDNQIVVNIRHYTDEKIRSRRVSEALVSWYKLQAKIIVQQRLHIWEKILNVQATGLKITSALRRWGSCNHKNSICINWRLIFAPLELVDYVIVHELCHIVHKNHSREFWRLVASVLPDYKARDKALNQQKMQFENFI